MSAPLWIILIFLSLLAIIVGIIFTYYLLQEALIFNPVKLNKDYKYHFKQNFEEIWFKINEEISLNAIHFKSSSAKGLIFYLHGNAENNLYYGEKVQQLCNYNYDLILFDYRTFGKSNGKIKRERDLQKDAKTVYLKILEKWKESDIIIYGYSLGTGIAARLASKNNPKALILESPYYNFVNLIRAHKFYLPADLITKYKFRTDRYLEDVKCPIYLIHGTEDKQVPYQSSVKLKQLHPKVNLTTINGGTHNDLMSFESYQDLMQKILN